MPPSGVLMGRRAFAGGGIGDAGSGSATGGVGGGSLPKSRFPRTIITWGDNSRRVKEEPRPESPAEEEEERQPEERQQKRREQQQQPPPPQPQQGKTPRPRAGRTGGWSTRICNEPGCSTVPSYGAPGTKRQFCLQVGTGGCRAARTRHDCPLGP